MYDKTVAVIAEFNPFHKGHSYILNEARRMCKADHVIVIMSPDFVQRGGPAIDDKYSRTKTALENGCDCVIELPVQYASASAGTFASSAIKLLDKTGVVNDIVFGSECGDIDKIFKLADILGNETPEFSAAVQSNVRSGLSYPSAINKALEEENSELVETYSSPNNRLGVEYVKALSYSKLTPHTLRRLPDINASDARTKRFISGEKGLRADDFSSVLMAKLLSLSAEDLVRYEDVSLDLAKRIFSLKDTHPTFEGLAEAVKTKAYTRTRIDRALTHIMLDIEKGYPDADDLSYIRVLGFRKSFNPVLSRMTKSFPGHVLIKLSEAPLKLSASDLNVFQANVFASDLYRSIRMIKYADEAPVTELSRGVIVL